MPRFEVPYYQQGTVLTKKGDLPPATQAALENLMTKAPFMSRTPLTPRPTGSSNVPPRFSFLNRPALIKPTVPNYSIITGGAGGGGPVLPQMDLTPSTEDKVIKPWYMEPKKVLPLAIGAAALFYLFTKKR
jgi:hypothetical protein